MSRMDTVSVLHVDDDAAFGGLLQEALERTDDRISVTTETDPTAAADRLRESSAFDCLVTDYEMPRMNGIELLERVRAHSESLPVILFTGQGSETVASEAISAGVTDYLQKDTGSDVYELLANRIVDAVAHREAETRVRRQATAIDRASEGIATVDREGRYVEVNRKYADMHRTDPEALVGTPITETLTDDAAAQFTETFDTLADGEEWTGDLLARRSDGEEFTKRVSLHAADDELGVIVARDITALDATGRYVRGDVGLSEAALLHTITDPVCAFDADGRFAFVNQTLCDAIGVAPTDLLGAHYAEITAEADVDRAKEAFTEVTDPDSETQVTTYQKRIKTGTGEWVPVEVKMAALLGASEIAVVGVVRDVSDRKERVSALKTQNHRLDEIAQFISHDMKTPLMTLRGCLSLVETDDEETLAKARRVVSRLEEMTDAVSELASDGWTVDDPETVSLPTVTRQAWCSVDHEGATLDVDLPDSCTVSGDRGHLVHAMENLLQNAVEHGDSPEILVTSTAKGVLIADDGPGLPDDGDSLFELGYSAGDGSGLGLAHVARIVAAHGWEISATDSPLGGAAFEIYTEDQSLTTATVDAVPSTD